MQTRWNPHHMVHPSAEKNCKYKERSSWDSPTKNMHSSDSKIRQCPETHEYTISPEGEP